MYLKLSAFVVFAHFGFLSVYAQNDIIDSTLVASELMSERRKIQSSQLEEYNVAYSAAMDGLSIIKFSADSTSVITQVIPQNGLVVLSDGNVVAGRGFTLSDDHTELIAPTQDVDYHFYFISIMFAPAITTNTMVRFSLLINNGSFGTITADYSQGIKCPMIYQKFIQLKSGDRLSFKYISNGSVTLVPNLYFNTSVRIVMYEVD